MIEHSTGNRKVLGSIPSGMEAFLFSQKKLFKYILKILLIYVIIQMRMNFIWKDGFFSEKPSPCTRMKLASYRCRKWSVLIFAPTEPYKVLDPNIYAKLAIRCSWIGPITEDAMELINFKLPQHFHIQQQYFQLNDPDENTYCCWYLTLLEVSTVISRNTWLEFYSVTVS